MSDLHLKMLGTGGAFVDFRENYHNNAIVETSRGWVMIDCGGTGPQSLKELGIKPWEIVAVLVTHIHGDHVNGLEQLTYERFYTGPKGPGWLKTTVVAPDDVLHGLEMSLWAGFEGLTMQSGEIVQDGLSECFDMVSSEDMEIFIGDVVFKFHRTPHVEGSGGSKPSYGVSIRRESASLYFSSDTTFRTTVGEMPEGKHVILHDCTFSPWYKGTVHTHYSDLLTLPSDVRSRMVLMHHNKVPRHIDVRQDGFLGALSRHEGVRVTQEGIPSHYKAAV